MIGAVKIVKPPHTRNVTLFKMAISLSESYKSCSMTKSAAGIAPESKLMKKLEARKVSNMTYLLESGTSVRSLLSVRSIEDAPVPCF